MNVPITKKAFLLASIDPSDIIEYKNTGTGNPWIHLSLTPSSNRGQSMTFWNHSRYKNVGTFYNLA